MFGRRVIQAQMPALNFWLILCLNLPAKQQLRRYVVLAPSDTAGSAVMRNQYADLNQYPLKNSGLYVLIKK